MNRQFLLVFLIMAAMILGLSARIYFLDQYYFGLWEKQIKFNNGMVKLTDHLIEESIK